MTERIQLNIRMDGRRELYDALREEAQRQGVSINQFVLGLIQAAVGMEESPTVGANPVLEERLARLEAQLALVPALVERLAEVEHNLGESVA